MEQVAAHRTAILGFLVAAAYWPGMLSAAFVPRWGAIAVGVPLLLLIDPRATPIIVRAVLGWVMAAALFATIWTSPDPLTGYLEWFFCAVLVLALFAGANLDSLDDLMTGLGTGLALSSAMAVLQWTDWWSPLLQTSGPSGLFFNSEVLAEFAALVFVWAALRPRWWIAAVALVPLLLCQSRVALAMIAVGLFCALRPRSRWATAGIALAMIAAGLLLIAVSGYKLETASHRLNLWGATVLSWSLFGKGLGWGQASFPFEGTAHSDALQAVAEVGVAAFALLMIPIMTFWRRRGHRADRAAFAAACCCCVISFPLHFPASGFLVAVLAGYLLSDRPWLRHPEYQRRPENGVAAEFRNAAGAGYFSGRRLRCRTLPVRPIREDAAARDTRAHGVHTGAA